MSWRAKRSVTSFDTFLNICLKAQFGQQDNTVGHFFNSKTDKTCQIATRLSIKSSQSVAVVMARGHLEMDISSKSKKTGSDMPSIATRRRGLLPIRNPIRMLCHTL